MYGALALPMICAYESVSITTTTVCGMREGLEQLGGGRRLPAKK